MDFLVSHRQRLFEKLTLCERLLLQLSHTVDKQAQIESVLAVLIPDLAEHFLLFHALDIPVSMALSTRLQQVISSHRGLQEP